MSTRNEQLLADLFMQGRIRLQRSPLFDEAPPPLPSLNRDRIGRPAAASPSCGCFGSCSGGRRRRNRSGGFRRSARRWRYSKARNVLRSRTLGAPYEGPLWRFLATRLPPALDEGLSVREACDRWYSGAYLLETMPSVIYILARHGDDPEAAIIRAINDTRDNDTVAAIVGAAVGALHGASALPERWREGLTGRTGPNDEGRVQELIAQACERWLSPEPPPGIG